VSWLRRNADAVEAAAAVVTALIAVVALVGIKLQLDAADRLQRAQSARDAFRAHLALSVNNPGFTAPDDACALLATAQGPAYSAYVEHLLYAAEQMLSVAEGWDPVFNAHLQPHTAYICQFVTMNDYDTDLAGVLAQFQSDQCPVEPICGDGTY